MMKKTVAILLTVLLLSLCCSCSSKDTATVKEEDIKLICELSTYKCYYNNVAKISQKKDNIFQKDREMWIEFEGVAEIGIDMSKVTIKTSDEKVTVTMPKAEVLSLKANLGENDKYKVVASKDGLFKNDIAPEDQLKAIKAAQEEMKKSVTDNSKLFERAEERAKTLITNYIEKIGEAIGTEYEIEWKYTK